MKMNFKPAFRYQFRSLLRGGAKSIIIILGVLLILLLFMNMSASNSSVTGMFGGTVAIFLFVMGIVCIRGDLRLCLQFGVSRRTSFLSELTAVLAVSALLSVVGEVITGIVQLATANVPNFTVSDLCQLDFFRDTRVLGFGGHMISALFNSALFFSSFICGVFFSLLFWRLNKFWTIVAAISIPFILNGFPILLHSLSIDLSPFMGWLNSSPFNFVLLWLLTAALVGLVDWLLLRRANIKAKT